MAFRRELIFKKVYPKYKTDAFILVGVVEGPMPRSPKLAGKLSTVSEVMSCVANGNVVRLLPHDSDYIDDLEVNGDIKGEDE